MKAQGIYPTLKNDSCVSHYNFLDEAKLVCDLPEKVSIMDLTLREGEQAAMSGFRPEDKVEIAQMLDQAGVHYIQVGYPGLSASENRMIKKITKLGLQAKVGGICVIYLPEWREQIEKAIDLGIEWVSVAYGLSPVRMDYVMKVPLEEAIGRCLEATELAAKKNLTVRFSATDTTRTPLETLFNVYRKAVQAGATMVSVADTAGAIGPLGMRYLVRHIRQAVGVPVVIHCHNDIGLAMANTMAGIEAGASLVDVTVNGIGERAGNAPLDEVAAALTHVFGYDLGIKLEKMKEISERVAQLSKIPLSPMKPLVGESSFTNTLGAHQWGARQGWFVYEPIRAEAVGNQRKFPLGRLTHHLLVRDKLAEQGYSNLSDRAIRKIAEKVRSLAEKEGRFVTEKELNEIGQQEIKKFKSKPRRTP